YYSDRLIEFPLGVFGIALATVILPSLSEQHARASSAAFSAMLDWALKLVLLIGVPAAVALAVLAEPLIATIFLGGEFSATDAAMAGASLKAYAPGLLGFMLAKVLPPGYFARHDTRTPVRVGVLALVASMVLNVLFVVALTATGWAPPHAGLAAATSVAALLNAVLLFRGLLRAGVYRPGAAWRPLLAQTVGGSAAMAVFLYWSLERSGDFGALGGLERVGWIAVLVVGGAAVYFAAAFALGLRVRALRAAVG